MRFPKFKNKWENKKLGEISDIYDGTHQTPKYTKEGVKFVSVENINDIYNTEKFISEKAFEKEYKIKPRKGDILMTRITAGIIGATTIVQNDNPLAYYVSLALIRIKSSDDVNFLAQRIETNEFKNELHKRIIHVAFPKKINLGDIYECSAYFPENLEQQKIASFLSLINDRIQTQKKIIGDLKFLKKEIAKKIINQELKFNNYPKTSVTWEKKRLGQIGKFYAGGDLNKLEYQKEKNDEYIYPIYANGSEDGLYGYCKTFQFPSNCVTVSGRGNLGFANVRKTPFCAIVRLIVIIPNDNINSNFLEEIINYTNFVIESTGVPQLTIPQISNYSILVPCLEEQNRIAHFLSSFDDKLYIEKKLLTQYENQKKYLLQNLFV